MFHCICFPLLLRDTSGHLFALFIVVALVLSTFVFKCLLFIVLILEIHTRKTDIPVYTQFWGFLVTETPNYAKAF